MAESQIVFAKLGNKGYIAGTSLQEIVSDGRRVFPEIPENEVVPIAENSLPQEYRFSVSLVKKDPRWVTANGVFLLIRDFEKYCLPSVRRYL